MDQVRSRPASLPVVNRGRTHQGRQASWRSLGACRDSDPNLFYPIGRGRAALEQIEEAKAICHTCPSREPCLDFALTFRQALGIWGGTSAEERRQMGRGRRRSVAS